MSIRAVLWTGGDAPERTSVLKTYPDHWKGFYAIWEPGYCGCPDCHPIIGRGNSEQEAIDDYREQWDEKYGGGS